MNPVYAFLQKLPTNGYTTAIGAVAAILFGVTGLVTGKLDAMTALVSISGGLTALGLGSKLEKAKAEFLAAKSLLGQQ